MNEKSERSALSDWLTFVDRLRPIGLRLIQPGLTIGPEGAADIRIIGLALLARTLSNMKGAKLLIDAQTS